MYDKLMVLMAFGEVEMEMPFSESVKRYCAITFFSSKIKMG